MTSPFVSKPSFCYIAPTQLLDPITDYMSTTHLVLAHLVDTDPIYCDYYQKMSARGDFIIMDNSAYELKTPYQPDKLVELGHACGATAIVLPDYPFQRAELTMKAADDHFREIRDAGFSTMFVPQSERGDFDDWFSGYEWARDNPNIDIIGYSILGIPNALPHIDPAFARVVMAQLLLGSNEYAFNKHSHYLGLNAGPALEIPSLLRMNVLDTVDSSGPVWAAINGHRYSPDCDSFQAVRKLTAPVDFSMAAPKNAETMARIRHNMVMTDTLFSGDQRVGEWYATE